MSNHKLIVGIISTLILGLLVYFIYEHQKEKNKIQWRETYQHQDRKNHLKPFDLSIFRECLAANNGKIIDVTTKLAQGLPKNASNSTYIFVGEALKADSNDIKKLLDFANQGNDILLSSKYISTRFLAPFQEKEIIEPYQEYQEDAIDNTDNVEEISVEEVPISDETEETEKIVLKEVIEDTTTNDVIGTADKVFFSEDGLATFTDSSVLVQLFSPDTTALSTGYYNYVGKLKMATDWAYFAKLPLDTLTFPVKKIGSIQRFPNFITFNYGKGRIFLHTTPILFTNIEIKYDDSKNYLKQLLTLLNDGDVYWDKNNQTTIEKASNTDATDNRKKVEPSPLKYILSNKSLAWAWYSLLAMGLLFLFFTAKRRQRIVPVLPAISNTSLLFIQNIGRIYFQRQDHTALARTQFKHWQLFLREKYTVKTNEMNEDTLKRIAQKSGVSKDKIEQIWIDGNYIQANPINEQSMIAFYNDVASFYKNCKTSGI